MKLRISLLVGLVLSLTMLVSTAFAGSIPVANCSFEMNNGFNNFCGGSCEFSIGLPIPGWNITGVSGQWIPGGYLGNPPAFDGSVLAFTNGGTVSQAVATATAGVTSTLQVEILHRTDIPMGGIAQLEVGGVVVATATAADAGKTLTILLTSTGAQGDWDDAVSTALQFPNPRA